MHIRKQIRNHIIPIFAVTMAAAAPAADAVDSIRLSDAIAMALSNNPELRSGEAKIEAAAGRAYQAKVWSNPELTVGVEDWQVTGGRGLAGSKQTVGVAQTIPFPGRKKIDREIGVSGMRLSAAELSLRRRELVRDVKASFYQVIAAERLVEVAGELVAVAESSAAAARKRVAAGAAADEEQLRAEIPLEQSKTELAGYRRELVVARQTLFLLLGRPDLSETPVTGTLAETGDLALLDRRPDQWLAGHPSVVAGEVGRNRAELELRRARLDPYPDVRMDVSGGYVGDSGRPILELGISLPVPVIDRGRGKQQEAQANVRMAEADRAAIEQRLLRAWGAAGERFRTAAAQAANYRERILPKSNEALRMVQTGFEQGKFGFIDLLDTQRTAAEVRLAYQQKLLELNLARADIEALLGRDSAAPAQSNTKP